MTSIRHNPTSATTSVSRTGNRPPAPPRTAGSCFNVELGSNRIACNAGASPKINPVTTDSAKVKTTTRPSKLAFTSSSTPTGLKAKSIWLPQMPKTTASAPPIKASTRLSVSICLRRHARLAPSQHDGPLKCPRRFERTPLAQRGIPQLHFQIRREDAFVFVIRDDSALVFLGDPLCHHIELSHGPLASDAGRQPADQTKIDLHALLKMRFHDRRHPKVWPKLFQTAEAGWRDTNHGA